MKSRPWVQLSSSHQICIISGSHLSFFECHQRRSPCKGREKERARTIHPWPLWKSSLFSPLGFHGESGISRKAFSRLRGAALRRRSTPLHLLAPHLEMMADDVDELITTHVGLRCRWHTSACNTARMRQSFLRQHELFRASNFSFRFLKLKRRANWKSNGIEHYILYDDTPIKRR